jgi:cytochrome P450
MWQYANRLIDGFIAAGSCEMVGAYAEPFTLTVIADLEGVPEADHSLFRQHLSTAHEDVGHKPLEFLYERFSGYIEDRRQAPRNDVLSGLATATFPDGSIPEVNDAALLAANLFAGGQETTVRLLSFALRMLAERPDLQRVIREDRARIPNFVEETLRVESPLRTQFRLARVRTQLGGMDIPAGSTIMLVPGACNRDPRVFDHPYEFDIDRANARQHIAFGHGIHTCAGAPLARAEGRVTINQFLDRTTDITISTKHHGPPGAWRYEYLPTFFLRGLQRLHLEFDT